MNKILLIIAVFLLTGCSSGFPYDTRAFQTSALPSSVTWSGVMERSNQCGTGSLPEFQTVEDINEYVNGFRFITDNKNYGHREYWATPAEFFKNRGGDCEDYVITKYCLIKRAGLSTDFEPAGVNDLYDGGWHMILVVDGMVLDNKSGHILHRDSPEIRERYRFLGRVNK